FKKIVLVRDIVKITRDEKGIVTMSIYDFLMDKDGSYYFSEINTLPGMSETSLFPQLFGACGEDYSGLLDGLIRQALEVYNRKQSLLLTR
ncbi:MAG: hypothetical protein IKO35_01475, partial [Elusimicrobiaceae bacterium]|nr:hypothetical protein [Elusimicrobiaceae bacterium]